VTAYQVGKRFEDKCRDHLRSEGYEVLRSAGSKTKIDLVAIKPGQLLFVQAKRDASIRPGEWDRLVDLAAMVGAIPVLACNGPAGRGVVYWRLTGRKNRGQPWVAQPAERFLTDELAGCPVHPGGDCPALPEMCGDRRCTCCRRPAVRQEWVSIEEDA
jgi:Holliday junction resolvase